MRLIRLALAIGAVSFNWAAQANPAINNSVSGTVSATAATQVVGSAAPVHMEQVALNQVGLNTVRGASLGGEGRASTRSTSAANGMNDSPVPSGWLMALVTVLLVGHQLRRKHRFLRPQRFSDL